MNPGQAFHAGDTFRPGDRKIEIHLWIVISDPGQDPDRVLIVSLTTFRPHKESACLLQRGDHRAVSHESCIAYEYARVTTMAQLEEAKTKGLILADAPVSDEILARIREGAAMSRRLSLEHFELLERQGLV